MLILTVAGCSSDEKPTPTSPTSPTTRPSDEAGALAKPDGAYDLDLDGSERSLDGLVRGAVDFVVNGDTEASLVIDDGVLRRDPLDSFGPRGAPSLFIDTGTPVDEVSATYRFSGGDKSDQNAVVGAADVSFAAGSIQFSVSPTTWILFYTIKKTDADPITPIVTIETGTFDEPLQTDGTTYTTTMKVDRAASSVTISFPGTPERTFTDPTVAELWGDKGAVQVRRPKAIDGDAEFTDVWTWSAPR